MKSLIRMLFLLLIAASAQAEIQSINITIFGMD
jgi:hypothetical protein